ncbi:MAG: hypothetical protein B7Y56_12420 [Gallionellales bacterium 35-53-114]|jgi:putative transferase (TIGR04331 family)|nr:MAG: hypothetical protein B7Y56_12420 [Gallionellales bacterium 35-53-114]OYZ63410.1 MAG: hypothetical protein B7Y04_08635 [Gallionellales bacterium 24-53-125]OZB10977.1 MAG: hypothetical protein B7X61_01055 [Gallionellales bacterium 39-52-133]HQS58837.1 hypothetical protein [Gallionellaceae bacterium]HQS75778.1 hypothetical protein [Gallionellaceae bacterium]
MNVDINMKNDLLVSQMLLVSVIEKKVTVFLANELEFGNLEMRDKEFIVAYWVHFFSHSALSIWFSGEQGKISNEANYRNIPADTTAFMGINRTLDYANYLHATLNNSMPETVFKMERQNSVLDTGKMRGMHVLLYKTGFSKTFRLWLSIVSVWKIRSFSKIKKLPLSQGDHAKRNRIASKLQKLLKEHAFGDWYSIRLVEFLPAIYLEDFSNVAQEYGKIKSGLKAIFSRDCWSSDDSLKLFSVLSANRENAKPLRIGSPHAMNYGALKEFWLRDYEAKYMDKYLSWGWSYPNITPFYVAQYSGVSRPGSPARIRADFEILITGAARPMHLLEYPYSVEAFSGYMNRQIGLAGDLAKETGLKVTIRTRQKERGQELENRISAFGDVGFNFEYQGEAFSKRVKNCLHISDNTSTTVIETLWLNQPTLLLIEPGYFEIWENAAAEFGELERAEIFHTSRESIVRFILENKGRINEWWSAPATQYAVDIFLDKQARLGGTLKDWKKVLLGEGR